MKVNKKMLFMPTRKTRKLHSEKSGDLSKNNSIHFNYRGKTSCKRNKNIQK